MQPRQSLSNFDAKLTGILLLFCIIVLSSISALPVAIEFEDAALEAVIREALDKPSGELSDAELLGITSLNARNRSIFSLEGIQHLVNLRELDLYGNEIVDISPLEPLRNLQTLVLSQNKIIDVCPLVPLQQLRNLQLRNNQIEDIQPLLDNPAFDEDMALCLSFNPLPIDPGSSGLGIIESLQERGMRIRFAPVIDFLDPGLEKAIRTAIGKESEDLVPLDLIGLTTLDARYHGITHLEGLELCLNLTELDLYGNELTDIYELSELSKLEKLSLQHNNIADLSPLAFLDNLTTLYLDNNQIEDLSPLSELTDLTVLYLWENDITDLTPLATLTSLTQLYLYFNRIVDISPLTSLTKLTGLGLSWNQIVDITPISELSELTRLYLDHNEIMILAPLAQNEGLAQDAIVHLQDNPFPMEQGSPNRRHIEQLQNRGVQVKYSPEPDSSD